MNRTLRRFKAIVVVAVGVLVFACAVEAQSKRSALPAEPKSGVDRLYVLDCGVGHAADQSRWSVGVNVGKPIDISVSCYLIHHAQGYFLWDTGISDHVNAMPDGWLPGNDPAQGIHWRRAKTLMSQLAELKLTPADIRYIGISHAHPDHIGNVERFPQTTVLIQKAEHESFFAQTNPGGGTMPPGDPSPVFSKNHPVKLIEEDLDVFEDGSVMIVYTPGHTPGHESCLVHLSQTGWLLLSGDAVHLRTNWDNRRLPYIGRLSSEAKLQTAISMQRMADLISFYHAQLWILHDKAQTDAQKHSPAYYE